MGSPAGGGDGTGPPTMPSGMPGIPIIPKVGGGGIVIPCIAIAGGACMIAPGGGGPGGGGGCNPPYMSLG